MLGAGGIFIFGSLFTLLSDVLRDKESSETVKLVLLFFPSASAK